MIMQLIDTISPNPRRKRKRDVLNRVGVVLALLFLLLLLTPGCKSGGGGDPTYTGPEFSVTNKFSDPVTEGGFRVRN